MPRPPDPDLHQHDLTPMAASRFVARCELSGGESVYEVGPGLGALTAALLDAGVTVHAIEIDSQRLKDLHGRFQNAIADGSLVLMPGDARHGSPPLPPPWRIIANPPFKHTAELLRSWLLSPFSGGPPARIDLLLQEQTALKWTGNDDDHTRSSVIAQLWGWPRRLTGISRDDVDPPAHVSLAHWALSRTGKERDPRELQAVDQLLDHAFAGPHSVREALRGMATPAILKKQGKRHRWHPDEHPRRVPPPAWLDLARYLMSIGRL